MSFYASENWTSTAEGAEIAFATAASGTTNPVERMRITNDGRIGIGTNTPTRARVEIVSPDTYTQIDPVTPSTNVALYDSGGIPIKGASTSAPVSLYAASAIAARAFIAFSDERIKRIEVAPMRRAISPRSRASRSPTTLTSTP